MRVILGGYYVKFLGLSMVFRSLFCILVNVRMGPSAINLLGMPSSRRPSKAKAKKVSSCSAAELGNHYVSFNLIESSELQDFLRYMGNPKKIFLTNFLAGTARGLGFIFGTVIVIAVLTFLISQVLSEIPWVGELFRWLDQWLSANIDTYSSGS
jgi:Na+-transporting methylmalonyl-CoA/oxaloacetate decarboxylase gamma subunit